MIVPLCYGYDPEKDPNQEKTRWLYNYRLDLPIPQEIEPDQNKFRSTLASNIQE